LINNIANQSTKPIQMKKGITLAIIFVTVFNISYSQSASDGLAAIDKENYESARDILKKVTQGGGGSDAMNWYYLGNAYCFLGKNDSARWAFTQGTNINPKSTACLVGIGKTYLNENRVTDAMKYFDQAKTTVNVRKDINIALYLADAYTHSVYPNNDEAVRILKTAENDISNKNPQLYMEMGDAMIALNRAGEAVSAYQRAAELNPSLARAHSQIGYIWYLARNYQLSLTSFEKAISIDATFAPAYRNLAELYYYTGQYEKAKDTFAKYLTLADKNDDTNYRYAQFLFLTKEYNKALTLLKEVEKQDSSKAIMFRLMGYSNYETGNYKEGLYDMNKFFKMAGSLNLLSSDYEYYGNLLMKTGRDSLAFLNIEKAIQLDSTKFELYKEIADTLYKRKKYGEAAVYYAKKIDKMPKPAGADYFSLGLSYYFDSAYVKADSAFKSVTETNPDWPNGYLWRARSNMGLENVDSVKGLAIPYYQTFIEKAMSDSVKYASKMTRELSESYRTLADIYYKLGQAETAIPYYEKYLLLNPTDVDIKEMVSQIKAYLKKKSAPKQ